MVEEHVHACQVCAQRVSFSIYGDSMGSALYLRLPQGASLPRAIVTNVSRSVTCQIGKQSYRESTGKVSLPVDAKLRYSTEHARYQGQKIPPIPLATPETRQSLHALYRCSQFSFSSRYLSLLLNSGIIS